MSDRHVSNIGAAAAAACPQHAANLPISSVVVIADCDTLSHCTPPLSWNYREESTDAEDSPWPRPARMYCGSGCSLATRRDIDRDIKQSVRFFSVPLLVVLIQSLTSFRLSSENRKVRNCATYKRLIIVHRRSSAH